MARMIREPHLWVYKLVCKKDFTIKRFVQAAPGTFAQMADRTPGSGQTERLLFF